MQLSIDREPQFFTRLSEVVVQCLAMIFWMAIAAYCWRCKTSTPPSLKPVAFLLLAPLLVLAPSSSFVPTADPMFEHRFYLPLAFVIWLVAELIDRLRQEHYFVFMHSTIFIRAIILVMLIGFATRSYLRANDYATSERIWRSALAIDPGNSRAAQNFVASLLESNQAQATLDVLTAMLIEAELEGKADDALAHQVARERLSRGDSYGAIKILALLTKQARHFDECVTDRQRREYGELWFDLAVAYAQVGRFELAISALKHTLIATPRDPIANQFAGDLYSQAGNNELANKHFRLVEEISKEIQ